MKKVRLTLKRRTKAWSFILYDSPESAFFLRDEPIFGEFEEYRRVITLSPGELIEVEWMGCEWIDDSDGTDIFATGTGKGQKFDKIRMGKITPVKNPSYKASYVELHSGWVQSKDIPWRDEESRDDVRITPIKGRMRSKIDFSRLFEGQGRPEADDAIEMSGDPSRLN